MLRKFVHTVHVPGTGTDMSVRWKVPSDCTLLHVSACTSSDDSAKMEIGDASDADAHLTSSAVGSGANAIVEFDKDDFVGTEFPRLQDGDTLVITVDTDGGVSGTGDDLTLVLTFVEG